MEHFYFTHPEYKVLNDKIEKSLYERNRQIHSGQLRPQRLNGIVTLPVVVHIIHNNGAENISDAQVLQGISNLNSAYANIGYYDPSDGVNTQIQFCMAQRDPANNLTNGITRNVSPYTVMGGANYYFDDQIVKNINRWNPLCYINIWLVKSIPGSVIGYAYLPPAHGSDVDGIVEEAAYFGTSGANDVVVAHEMGHYLGLYHTFEGGCTNNDCASEGDKVCDTPPDQSTSGISCTSSVNSCTSDVLSGFATDQNDLTTDYMDYGNFYCMKVFTQGQANRMNWFLQNVRQSLLNCKSCMLPCPLPVTAGFITLGLPINAGTGYVFTNTSVNAATYEWYVNGMLQSTAFNFNYTFPAVGNYAVKLIAKSGNTLCYDATKTITIVAACGVFAKFTKSSAIVTAGSNINFTNTSTGAGSFEWVVNDVLQSTSNNFLYTSSLAGRYIIKLMAKNISANCSDEYIDTVEYTCPLSADFTPLLDTVDINKPVTFNSTGPVATTYQWLVNGIAEGSGPTFTYTFNVRGSYVIQLIAGNGTCSSARNGVVIVADKCGNKQFLFQGSYAVGTTSDMNDIRATADGGSVLAGSINAAGSSQTMPAILKLDGSGNVQWMNTYTNNAAWGAFNKIKTTRDKGYIAIGTTSGNDNISKILIVKALSTGAIEWSRELRPDSNQIIGTDIIQSTDGYYYFTGSIYISGGITFADAIVGKLTATGNIAWMNTYDAGSNEQAFGLSDDASQLIVCGEKYDQSSVNGLLLKINKADGSPAWSKTYQPANEVFNSVMVIPGGYYIDAERNVSSTNLFTDHVYHMTDATGNLTYSKYIRPFGTTQGIGWASSFVKPDGNIISITSPGFGGTYQDFLIQEINPSSRIVWTKKYNRPDTWMLSGALSADNGLLLQGFVNAGGAVPYFLTYVMKLDSEGNSGSCPSENAQVELLSAQYNTMDVNFSAKQLRPQIISNHIATSANVIVNTICQFTTCDSTIAKDSCKDCNILQLSGKDTICNLGNIIPFKALRNPLCSLPVQWSIDTSFAIIISSDDSTAEVKFKKEGAVKLFGQFAATCDSIRDSLQINIFTSPDHINLGIDIQLCKFSTLKLSAGSGFKTYLWNDGSVDSTLTAYITGRYFVKAVDYCDNTYFDTINISQAPDIIFDLGPGLEKCDNDTLTITAPGSFSKYTWSPDYNINTIDGSTVKVWPAVDTSYSVVAEVTQGCTAIDTIRITINRSEPINIGNDTSFCIGGSVIFKAPGGFVDYKWQDASAGQTFTATQKGIYWVNATNTNGCISKDTAEVKEAWSLPVVSLGDDLDICFNEIHVFNAGAGFKSYLWQDNSTNATYSTGQTGIYRVQVTDKNGCKNADTVSIIAYKPVPQNFLDASVAICAGRNNELQAIGVWMSYLWSNNANGSSITITSPGDYWLEVSNAEGCTARDTIKVIAKDCINSIYFPNAFTPNNDARNDIYKPTVMGVLKRMGLTIYNRFGEKVFESTDPLKGWDGTYKGRLLDTDTFVWYCSYQFVGGQVIREKGTIVLIR